MTASKATKTKISGRVTVGAKRDLARRALFGPFQVEAFAGVDPGVAGHAAYGVEFGGIDAEVVFEIFADVNVNDLADHHDSCSGALAGEDDL